MKVTLDLTRFRADAKQAFEESSCSSCRTLAAMVLLLTTAVAEKEAMLQQLAIDYAEYQLRVEKGTT